MVTQMGNHECGGCEHGLESQPELGQNPGCCGTTCTSLKIPRVAPAGREADETSTGRVR